MIGQKTTYINWKCDSGVETLSQVDRKDFQSWREYVNECKNNLADYSKSHWNGRVWLSRRATKEWRDE